MKTQTLHLDKKPILKVHKYIATIGGYKSGSWHTRYRYCLNMKEVDRIRQTLKPNQVMEVYRAVHEFVRGWHTIEQAG